ncbi:hypothetical protein GS4_43_00330 [Gordonia soli NBRC 108243]|uniref:SnoaL-like domain-containing protein n=1 Tax=Gordonia soli NBRC 108243 TaxID=1223545 RepID=M0QRG3_9ACTN|nr:hypothetical protein GS4_43_00330 [Gordonia soli NBRC 108243]
MALYDADATAEWVFDGMAETHRGISEISAAADELATLWRSRALTVHKQVESATADTIVLSWTGGFGGRDSQIGVEIWTLADGLVVGHRMYGHLDVRASDQLAARLRLAATSPRIATAIARHRMRRRIRRAIRGPESPR